MIRNKKLIVILLISLWGASHANAYVDFAPNANLISEVKAHPFRVMPRGENFAFAIDADFFKPAFSQSNVSYYNYDYYHGNGYWLTLRAEYKPIPELTLNLKTIITHGTSSNGPSYLALIVPLLGITYEENIFGFDITTRLSEIGRQTVGSGLFIEEKEIDGGYLQAKKNIFSAKMMVDGTGSYRLDGGVIAFDVNLWNGMVGGTWMINEEEMNMNPPKYVGSLYSKHQFENGFGYGVEAGADEFSWAGISYVEYRGSLDRFHFWIKPQARHYGKRIMGTLPGRVAHTYVTYEQNDKPYTSFINILSYGDNVNTLSAQLNAEYIANSFYRIFGETEALSYNFYDRKDYRNFFFRTGVKLYPFSEREDHFSVLIGNKYLCASNGNGNINRTYSLPNSPDLENKPLFIHQLYVMANFSAKF